MITKRANLTGVTNTIRKVKQSIETQIMTIPTFVGCTSHQLFTVNGTIVDSVPSGEGVKDCRVLIDDEYIYDNIITDSSGVFSIKGLTSGNHNIKLFCEGFLQTCYTFTLPNTTSSTPVDIGNFVLTPVGTNSKVHVTLMDDGGNYVVGAKVELVNSAGTTVQSYMNLKSTFTFEPVRVGEYTIKVTKKGYEAFTSEEFEVTDKDETSLNLVLTQEESNNHSLTDAIDNAQNNFRATTVEVFNMTKITSLKEAKELLYTEGDTPTTNPLYYCIEDFFTEVNADKTDFEKRWLNNNKRIETADTIPYIYAIDLGKRSGAGSINNSLIGALKLFGAYEDTDLFCISGLTETELITGDSGLLDTLLQMLEMMDEFWTHGKMGNILLSFKGQDERLPTEVLSSRKYFNKNLINVLDYKYLGHVCGRFCTTPVNVELGLIPFRSLEIEDVVRKTDDSYIVARNNGLVDIRVQPTSYGKYPRIELGVNTLFASETIYPESKIYNKRVFDSIIREMDEKAQDYIKMSDTNTVITMLNTEMKSILLKHVNAGELDENSFVRVLMADKTTTDAIVEARLIGTPLLENIEVSVTTEWAKDTMTRYYSLI